MEDLHERFAENQLLPSQHLVDKGYVDAEVLAKSQQFHQGDVVVPALPDTSWASKATERFDQSQFSIDWEAKSVLCPAGQKSRDGVISLIDRESRVFVYGFLYPYAELVPFMLNVHPFRQKSFFCAQIHKAFRHFKKLVNVRKPLNFERSLRNVLALKAQWHRRCEPARSEDPVLLDSRS